MTKFRSIKAFRDYESRSRTLDPFRIVSLLKRHPDGMRIKDIVIALEADPEMVHEALWTLQKKDIVAVKHKDGDELVTFS